MAHAGWARDHDEHKTTIASGGTTDVETDHIKKFILILSKSEFILILIVILMAVHGAAAVFGPGVAHAPAVAWRDVYTITRGRAREKI